MKARAILLVCVVAFTASSMAHADERIPRHWIARIGVHPINPKPNSHAQFEVDNAAGASLGATYLFTKHWALELFSAFPNTHDLHDADGARSARFSMMPTSATLQYHITDASGRFRTYAGAGVSYARMGSEQAKGPLSGHNLDLQDSTGITFAIGVDMDLGTRWFVNLDARWSDIDSSMKLDSASIGQLEIDPYMLGLSLGRRLR